jgi:hypothetical protein
MKKILWFAVVATMAFASFGVSVASASSADVIRRGSCSADSNWKLKLSPDNGRIEVEFEVDQNVVGDVWRVRMLHNGDVFFRGRRTTKGPSGSFEVRQFVNDASGTDRFVAKARNTSTDELCRGTASI